MGSTTIGSAGVTFPDATVQATAGVTSVGAGTGISSSGGLTPTITNTGVTSIVAGTGITVSGATGAVTVNASGGGVSSFAGGTTGLTPAAATTGAITLAGVLAIANGGTGSSTGPTAASITGVLAVANGGTGSATGAINLANATGLPLTTGVSGVLPRANGGTGLSVAGTNGNVLTSDGTNWISKAPSGGSVPSPGAVGSTASIWILNLSGGPKSFSVGTTVGGGGVGFDFGSITENLGTFTRVNGGVPTGTWACLGEVSVPSGQYSFTTAQRIA